MDLHRVNIAHRDLKPENLLLETKDSVFAPFFYFVKFFSPLGKDFWNDGDRYLGKIENLRFWLGGNERGRSRSQNYRRLKVPFIFLNNSY
jgi:serine/threonine protein kinase